MEWTKLAERYPPKCELVLLRYKDERRANYYIVAWYDSGLWWLDANRTLNRHFDNVTHWTQIKPPSDVLAPIIE